MNDMSTNKQDQQIRRVAVTVDPPSTTTPTKTLHNTNYSPEWPIHLDLVHNITEFSSHLHGRLDSINGHEENAKTSRSCRRRHCLEADRQISGGFVGIHESHHSSIGRRVTKSREWTLYQGRQDTTVKSRNAAIGVECSESSRERDAVAVLVVDGCSHPLSSMIVIVETRKRGRKG